MLTLQYSKHGECILQEIGAAFRGEHPADLLLVCDGKETLRAHKLVLAAASPLIRMLLEEIPTNEGLTTVHFPDVHVNYFRLLLDFLYSGQTYLPASEVDHMHDLLALLQIKPGIWRTGDKIRDHHHHHHHGLEKGETLTDINSNEDELNQRHRSKSRESSNSRLSVKRERQPESSCDDDREEGEIEDEMNEDEELDDETIEKISREGKSRNAEDESTRHMEDEMHSSDREDLERIDDDRGTTDDAASVERVKNERLSGRRRSSSDPVNLSISGRGDDSDGDAHIDVESIGSAPSKVKFSFFDYFFCGGSFFNSGISFNFTEFNTV